MRTLILLPFIALAACSGENSGWNPNYQAQATPYGDYLRQRELALTGARAEPPRIVPVALPVNAPTAQDIAGPSPVRILERATTPPRQQTAAEAAARARLQSAPVRNRAPAVDPRLTPPQAVVVPQGTARRGRVTSGTESVVTPLSGSPLLDSYAATARNAPGTPVWPRANPRPAGLACTGFASPAAAQDAFLSNGGPGSDRFGLDPDGDGYACGWRPSPRRVNPL